MKRKFFKRLLVSFASLFALATSVYVYGCADGWWGYSYVSSFTPEAFTDDSYKPFFYAPEEKFYDYTQLEYIEKYNEDIVTEWQAYLRDKPKKSDLAFYLLNDSAKSDIESLYNQLDNPVAKHPWLADEKGKKFITFLHFAKAIEISSTNTFSSWDYEDRIVVQTAASLVDEVEDFYNKIEKKDTFFKNRMWFQVLKAKFYGPDRASVIPFFEATSSAQPKNGLYYRAVGYVAGAYYQQERYEKSNALFALLFNNASDKRHEALYNFRPLSADSLELTLQQIEEKQVKASVWAMNGYYHDAATAMAKIYALQPNSPHLDFLLTRWVNEQESTVNEYYNLQSSTYPWDGSKIDRKTLSWLAEILKQPKKLHNPALVYLAYGYVNMFINEHELSKQTFVKAEKYSKGKPLMMAQIRLFKILNEVAQLKTIQTKDEEQLLPELVWLYQEVPQDSALVLTFRHDYAANWIKTALSSIYNKDNNSLMAELWNSEPGFFDNSEQGAAMEKFLLQEPKNGWNKLASDLYPYSLSDIYESRSIYAYYQQHIEEAIDLMKRATPQEARIDRGYDGIYYQAAELRGNPFNGKIKDCNDCDHAAPQKVKYTKLDFLVKVGELRKNIDQGIDVYTNALLLGNAYYNSSYFGNARVFYYNTIIGEYGNYIGTKNQPYILGMSNARKYYEMALKAAQNKEQRAKVTYLLAKVDRNEFYTSNYLSREDYYWADPTQTMFKAWAGFKTLKNEYSDTKYYQEVIRECGYFRSYIAQEDSKGRN
ncbi:hypothetical protein [Sphingobacterium deserti]|uniref:Uncharacterized protein n=1 Tax=Sphingobacterium deserti TaxID=1229276 RepID=A0A0B8T0J4_9SPHI|nr:hypothetical protein [Sphingobacterium deserti]KGE13861.1 hypothetical protein DI53_2390 [Sphingobacterium deserti]